MDLRKRRKKVIKFKILLLGKILNYLILKNQITW